MGPLISRTMNRPRPRLPCSPPSPWATPCLSGSKISFEVSGSRGGPLLVTSRRTSVSSPMSATWTGAPGAPYLMAFETRLRSDCCSREPSHWPRQSPRTVSVSSRSGCAPRNCSNSSDSGTARSTCDGVIRMPRPSRVRLKSTRSSTRARIDSPLRIRRAAAMETASPAFRAARCDAVATIVLSGLRMSCPSMPRSRFLACSTWAWKCPTDSAIAWSMASLNRTMSSSPASPSGPAPIHRRSTLARSARYSATSWLMSNPPRARSTACVWAAVSGAPSITGARPFDFSDCSSAVWGVARSFATASRMCGA